MSAELQGKEGGLPPAETERDVAHLVRVGRRDVRSAGGVEEAFRPKMLGLWVDDGVVVHAPDVGDHGRSLRNEVTFVPVVLCMHRC